AIAVEVSSVDAHTRARPTRFAVCDTRCKPDLLKLPTTFVEKEKVRHRVVRDEEIHQPVVVYIGGDSAKRFTRRTGDARLTTHVLKRAVAIVMKESRRLRLEESWNTVITLFQSWISAERIL